MADDGLERITKIMSGRGMCSRREAEKLIDAGQVVVNGVIVKKQGFKALPDADIRVTAAGNAALDAKLTVLLHKPVGVVSAQPEPGQTPAWKLLTPQGASGRSIREQVAYVVANAESFAVAGRLDRASRGLLVMTQDGTVARQIIGGNGVEKVYEVRLFEPVTDAQIRKMRGPLELDGVPLLPMGIERIDDDKLRFTLREGRNHQIRRVCRRFGLEVDDLLRRTVGPFRLDGIKEGLWRVATTDELAALAANTEFA